jgi:putative transposase
MPYRYLKRLHDTPYFHIYNRGNNKKNIFLSPHDYERFIFKLKEYAEFEGVSVLAYCLMRNHFHLLLAEEKSGDIACLMQRLGVAYAMYFNLKYGHVGHLFQGPYGERAVESTEDLLQVSAYIHNNPMTLGGSPEEYRWSSYADYLSGQSSWVNKDAVLGAMQEVDKVAAYKHFVSLAQDLVLLPG